MSFLENRKNYKHSAMNSSINGIGKYIFGSILLIFGIP